MLVTVSGDIWFGDAVVLASKTAELSGLRYRNRADCSAVYRVYEIKIV